MWQLLYMERQRERVKTMGKRSPPMERYTQVKLYDIFLFSFKLDDGHGASRDDRDRICICDQMPYGRSDLQGGRNPDEDRLCFGRER